MNMEAIVYLCFLGYVCNENTHTRYIYMSVMYMLTLMCVMEFILKMHIVERVLWNWKEICCGNYMFVEYKKLGGDQR